MITASVQQASQTIEIKGAPPDTLAAAANLSEEFGAAFAASVRGSAPGGGRLMETPVPAKAPTASDVVVEKKASDGSPVSAKLAVAVSEGGPAKASTKVQGLVKTSAALIADASAGDKATALAAGSMERASIVGAEPMHASTEDLLVSALLQGGAEIVPGATAIAEIATAVKNAPRRDYVLADVPATGVVSRKQPVGVAANTGSHNRRGDVAEANKYAASSATGQASQISLNAPAGDLSATAGQAASLTASSLVVAASAAAEPQRLSERANASVPLQVAAVAEQAIAGEQAKSRAQTSGVAASTGTAGEDSSVRRSSVGNKGGALPRSGSAIADRTGTVEAQATPGAGSAHRGPDGGGVGAVDNHPSISTERSLTVVIPSTTRDVPNEGAAGLPHRPIGVSERLPMSTVLPDASSSGEVDKTIRLQEMVESNNVSAKIGDGMQAGDPEAALKLAATGKAVLAADPGAIVRQQRLPDNSHTSMGASLEAKAATNDGLAAAVPEAASTEVSLQTAYANPVDAQIESAALTPVATQSLKPAELPRATVAGAPPVNAAGKDKIAKRPVDEIDSTTTVPQSGSGKDSAPAVPIVAVDGNRDGVKGLVANAGGNAVTPLTHSVAAVVTVAVPEHGSSPALPPIANSASARTETGLDGVMTAQSSAPHSVEPHRTLLATPTALEVGVQSGTQGWLKIRAEVGGQGEVKASLDAVSASGRDLLHSQLPALNAFLHSEQMPVTASVAERSTELDGSVLMRSGGTDGFVSSNGSLLQDDSGQRQTGQPLISTVSEPVKSYDALGGVSDSPGAPFGLQGGLSAESGRWLNVRV